VISGLDAVFAQEEQAIILEDDCLPDPSFFTFCETLLKRYKNDEKVMHIGGNNFQNGKWIGDGDYYFSRYAHIWGWATWRRVWHKNSNKPFPFTYPDFWTDTLKTIPHKNDEQNYWTKIFEQMKEPGFKAWSYNWQFCIWQENGICILPNRNLVLNIGFGENSTHTKNVPSYYKRAMLEKLEYLREPSNMNIEYEADKHTFYTVFYSKPLPLTVKRKIIWRIKKLLQKTGITI
jgi:hypothetical protein